MANTHEQVVINGTVYNVTTAWTPESLDADGKANTAAHLRKVGAVRQLGLVRPKGRGAHYFVVEFAHKRTGRTYFGNLVSLGM